MSLLNIDNLSVSFPSAAGEIRAVDGISYTLEAGETLALVGESGSGKSVSALALLGLLPESATITGEAHFSAVVAGENIISEHTSLNDRHSEAKAEESPMREIPHLTRDDVELLSTPSSTLRSLRGNAISMIFQEPMTALNPLHTIGKQIAEVLQTHPHPNPPPKGEGAIEPSPSGRGWRSRRQAGEGYAQQRTLEIIDAVGLSHFKTRLDAYPHQLSGGERQRVMIAMACINRPRLLIADEPTTALDVTIQTQILELLKKLQLGHNMGMLLITHDLTMVRKIADKVAVMQQGKLVEQGTVQDIFANPQHVYTQKLLSSEPSGAPFPIAPNAAEVMACEHVKVYFPRQKGLFTRTREVVKAVDGVSLTVREGETLGIVGESGSGKTTLAMALLRLIKSDGPIVFLSDRIDRHSFRQLRTRRDQLQLVFQDPFSSLNPRMPVVEIIGEGLRAHRPQLTREERREQVIRSLEEVGLTAEMADRYPHEFSGGQRQRIAIARAMVLKPRFVVLDEPTSALDLTVQAQIADLLRSLQEDHGIAYLFISHDLRVVRAVSHRIVVLKGGKIVEQGTTEAIFSSPQEDYTKTLIEAAFAA